MTAPEWSRPCVTGQCEFVGEYNDEHSPYIDCGGDPRRHERTPVAARFRTSAPSELLAPVLPLPPPSVVHPLRPTRTAPSGPRAARRTIVRRITCPTCRRPDTAVMDGPEGPVITNHGPRQRPCTASEQAAP